MSNNGVQFSSIIDGISKRKDGSITIRLVTSREFNSYDTAQLFDLGNQEVWTALKPTQLGEVNLSDFNIPEIIPEFKSDKTPSQRLRNTIYVWWKQLKNKSITQKDFDVFYKEKMEMLINYLQESKLENEA